MSSRRATRRGKSSSASDSRKTPNINYEESLIEDEDVGTEEVDNGDVEDEDSLEEVTRCICHHYDLFIPPGAGADFDEIDTGFYIQCEECSVWQHGYCVGIKDESHSPEKYWCEQCRPQMHNLFTDKYSIRRSRYNPDYDANKGKKRSTKRSAGANGNSNGTATHSSNNVTEVKTEDEVDGSHTHSGRGSPSPSKKSRRDISTANSEKTTTSNQTQESPLASNLSPMSLSRRDRTRHRDAEYELQLKKALEESAKECGVLPDEAEVSASESLYRETRSSRKRGPESLKKDDEESSDNNNSSLTGLASAPVITGLNVDRKKRRTGNNNSEVEDTENLGSDYKKIKDEEDVSFNESSTRLNGNPLAETASLNPDSVEIEQNDSNIDGDAGSSSSSSKKSSKKSKKIGVANGNKESPKNAKGKGKKDKEKEKDKSKESFNADKPFTPHVPDPRISLAEMHNRVLGITEFISNTQAELANGQAASDNLMNFEVVKKETDDTGKELEETHKTLISYYNDSVEKLESLAKKLSSWEQKYGNL